MNKKDLIGQKVMHSKTKSRGIIREITNGKIVVDFYGDILRFNYPADLNTTLILENQELRKNVKGYAKAADFERFQNIYSTAIQGEIACLRRTGGRTYHAVDGVRLKTEDHVYLYTFDTDTEFHFPDGTGIRIRTSSSEESISGSILSCDEYTITIQADGFLGQKVERIEFIANQWFLLEELDKRVNELDQDSCAIAYDIACNGKSKIEESSFIHCGQDAAFKRAISEPITFIWGPPGTGKTYTLATIALDYIRRGKRVLMLSYSNVSVDEAILRVDDRSDYDPGTIIRYGYPRKEEILNNDQLASYRYVLYKNPELKKRYDALVEERRHTPKKSEKRLALNQEIDNIRQSLKQKERELVQTASFVATTVSKAVVDKAIYEQKFDLVIFDEASMAYVPQIIFSASLAKTNFVCLGDFRQLPAITENEYNGNRLEEDIFQYTGITEAVENDCGHEWLIMLTEQHRMHPDIAGFVSKALYNDNLTTDPNSIEQNLQIAANEPLPDAAMTLLDLSGMYSVCIKTMDGSRVNVLTAMLSVRLAEKFYKKYDVGIITPYNAQSSFITSILRDLEEKDPDYANITCATVHQFQGSEKSIIIYDATDCYMMQYPGTLLTNQKNGLADRLFNVALTRARGKFFLLVNKDFFDRKKLSKNLFFAQMIRKLSSSDSNLKGTDIMEELKSEESVDSGIYFSDREKSWELYLKELSGAKEKVWIEIPGMMAENSKALKELGETLQKLDDRGVELLIRENEEVTLPKSIRRFVKEDTFVSNPITVIDQEVVWFGHPMADENFVSNGEPFQAQYFPCARSRGKYMARSLKALLM